MCCYWSHQGKLQIQIDIGLYLFICTYVVYPIGLQFLKRLQLNYEA